ncbi:diacylglycerol/lipid kinase family protein [Oceanobacillus sojae]|uniref:Putative lipid kinase YtlR n=1 Tax=Oceanobacillus sojae TaxID=582851 RepID=A0A511ZKI0_9BACI|nr:YegS/Rv2252/BmrU family lipid kinase [Oceanobacillus sojae]GEN87963.1 putative lipid kinase YtlR [Oceanobacillus sojae]
MYLLIVNPNAGNGHAKKIFERIQKMTSYRNIERKTLFTNQPGDGQIIAETYSKKEYIKHVIVIGGDGTMHEVMNGWSNQSVSISFIPGGSGNDFAKGIGQRDTAEKQWQNIISNPAKPNFWNGSFQLENGREKKFINSIGIGIDAATTEIANQSHLKIWLNQLKLGKLIYLIALIQAILRFQPMNIRLTYDGRIRHIENTWIVSAANHPYCGGGLKVVPHATVNPHNLSILVIHQISKKKILLLFLLVIFGLHQYLKEVELFQVKEMTIEVESPVSYQADGETGRLQTCYIKRKKQAVYIKK